MSEEKTRPHFATNTPASTTRGVRVEGYEFPVILFALMLLVAFISYNPFRDEYEATYTVGADGARGEGIIAISEKLGVSVEALIAANLELLRANEARCAKEVPNPTGIFCNPRIGMDGRPLPEGAEPVPGWHALWLWQVLNKPPRK